jgi:hypothetical protein
MTSVETNSGRKEVKRVKKTCFCGRTGEIEDREPLMDGDARRALRCPDCGHVDHLYWFPDDARRLVFEEAERRELAQHRLTA